MCYRATERYLERKSYLLEMYLLQMWRMQWSVGYRPPWGRLWKTTKEKGAPLSRARSTLHHGQFNSDTVSAQDKCLLWLIFELLEKKANKICDAGFGSQQKPMDYLTDFWFLIKMFSFYYCITSIKVTYYYYY